MKSGIVNIHDIKRRMDVNYHLSSSDGLEEYWTIEELKEIVVRDPSCYGFKYCNYGIPIIRISDLNNPFIDYSSVAFINDDIHNNFNKTHLQKNDILMSVRGVSIGKIGIYLGEYKEANISPNIIIIRLKEKELAPYVAMVLVSSIGQNQIKKIIAGSSKPTINASYINKIQIPKPTPQLLEQVKILFSTAEEARKQSFNILEEVEEIFNSEFGSIDYKKDISYKLNSKKLGNRWDPHFHNPLFERLRKKIDSVKDRVPLNQLLTNIRDTMTLTNDEKIGYIQITNVNNSTGTIDSFQFDYAKKLPSGGKIELKDGDILVSKVRPYRNAVTIYRSKTLNTVTASKNAFSVYRTLGYYLPYYVVAFLRHSLGINQIIMKQSGTSYPTVSEEEINETEVFLMSEEKMKIINDSYKLYFSVKDIEENSRNSILDLLTGIVEAE